MQQSHSELLDQDAGERLLKKPHLTESQRVQVEHYIFERTWPGFLDSLVTTEGKKDCVDFYAKYQLGDRGRWLKTVVTRWSYKNRKELTPKDFKDLTYRLKAFEEVGVNAIADLKNLKSAYFKFVEDIKLLEFFSVDKIYTLRDIVGWVYKLEGAKLDLLMGLVGKVGKKDSPAKVNSTLKELTSELPKPYITKLRSYFKFIVPSTLERLKKLTVTVKTMLERFGYSLKYFGTNHNNDRSYKVINSDSEIEKTYRVELEEILKNRKIKNNLENEGSNDQNVDTVGNTAATVKSTEYIHLQKITVAAGSTTAQEFQPTKAQKSNIFLKPAKKEADLTSCRDLIEGLEEKISCQTHQYRIVQTAVEVWADESGFTFESVQQILISQGWEFPGNGWVNHPKSKTLITV